MWIFTNEGSEALGNFSALCSREAFAVAVVGLLLCSVETAAKETSGQTRRCGKVVDNPSPFERRTGGC